MSCHKRRRSFPGPPASDSRGVRGGAVGGGVGGQDHQQGRPLSPPRHRGPSAGPQMRPGETEQDGKGLQEVYSQSSIPGYFDSKQNMGEGY